MHQVTYKSEKRQTKRVYLDETDAVKAGYAVCYERDNTDATDQDGTAIPATSSSWGRHSYVKKPAAGNLWNFAGIVANDYAADAVGQWIDIIEPTGHVEDLWTDVSATTHQTRLTVQAGSYAFGAFGEGPVVGYALQTVNRATTNGRCQAVAYPLDIRDRPHGDAVPSSTVNTFSPAIWESCPWHDMQRDPSLGFTFFDDFLTLPTGKWTATQATTGTWALDDAVGGVALADCNSTTVTQGINVQLNGAAGEIFRPAAGRKIWFEARVKAADIATGPEFFLGLANIDTTVIGTSAVSTTDHLAFTSVTDDGVLLLNGEKGGTGNTEAGTTLVDDTWVNLGLLVDGVTTCTGYVNGVATATALVTANIPILEMVPTIVCQSDGSTDSIVHVDWMRIAQTRVTF